MSTLLKCGQIVGALLLIVAYPYHHMTGNGMLWFLIVGGALYAVCRLAAWLRQLQNRSLKHHAFNRPPKFGGFFVFVPLAPSGAGAYGSRELGRFGT